MIGLGTIINTAAIIIGGLGGMLFGKNVNYASVGYITIRCSYFFSIDPHVAFFQELLAFFRYCNKRIFSFCLHINSVFLNIKRSRVDSISVSEMKVYCIRKCSFGIRKDHNTAFGKLFASVAVNKVRLWSILIKL